MTKFAIIETGGHQYKVEEGMKVQMEKIEGKDDEKVVFDDVLLVVDGDSVVIGQPKVAGVSVEGKITIQGRDKKITIFKKWSKKRREVKKGHRQSFTEVEITKIGGGTKKAAPEKKTDKDETKEEKPKKAVAKKKVIKKEE